MWKYGVCWLHLLSIPTCLPISRAHWLRSMGNPRRKRAGMDRHGKESDGAESKIRLAWWRMILEVRRNWCSHDVLNLHHLHQGPLLCRFKKSPCILCCHFRWNICPQLWLKLLVTTVFQIEVSYKHRVNLCLLVKKATWCLSLRMCVRVLVWVFVCSG